MAAPSITAHRTIEGVGHVPAVDAGSTAARTTPAGPLASPWSIGQCVGTAADQERFVADLRIAASAVAVDAPRQAHQRLHVTAIVTALRGGVSVAAMLERAPGLRPDVLLAAYEDLADRRSAAELAWRSIVDQPTPGSLASHGSTAAQLLPDVVGHLRALVASGRTGEFALEVRTLDQEITHTVTIVDTLEAKLDAGELTEAQRRQVDDLLFDQVGGGAWSAPMFLAPRVGALVPARVRGLLGD